MEQVRELLFGAQLKDVDTRFQRLEERLLREVSDVQEALKTRLDSLENFMKSETGSLLHRLQEEQAERESAVRDEQRERSESLSKLAKELAATADTFERRNTKLSAALDATERELRNLLMAESSSLSSKVEERYQDALNVLSNTAAQIRHDMVYRSALSGMFTDLAVKLSGQWTLDIGQILTGEPAAGGDPEA
jgi:phenylalanyl-tRNA synthetase alpha subunit